MLVRHALAPKAVGGRMAVVGLAEEEVDGADTKIPVSYELRPL